MRGACVHLLLLPHRNSEVARCLPSACWRVEREWREGILVVRVSRVEYTGIVAIQVIVYL